MVRLSTTAVSHLLYQAKVHRPKGDVLIQSFKLWSDPERDGVGSVTRTKGDSKSDIDAPEIRFDRIPTRSLQHGRAGLMMTVMLVAAMFLLLSQIFYWVLVEGFLTTGRAEVVGLAFVIRFEDSRFFINFHAAYGINCHGLLLLAQMIYIHKYIATNLLASEPFIVLKNRHFCLHPLSNTANDKKLGPPIIITEVNMSVPYIAVTCFMKGTNWL
jgi:hypothetical protein